MEVGVALRSEVFEPPLIRALARGLDQYMFGSVWFPDVAGFEPLELAALTLGATSRIRAATGVLRFHEHDPAQLARRVRTLQAASEGRLIVGVGSGAMRGIDAVKGVERWVEAFRRLVGRETQIYVAALRGGMFSTASRIADGVLLNFCDPKHVEKLVHKQKARGFKVACYIKLFYAQKDFAAKRMLAEEFAKYDSYPHYHRLFEEMGVAETIREISRTKNPSAELLKRLSSIALYNPSKEEVLGLLAEFTHSGVDLPIVYPYVEGDPKYKADVIKRLSDCFQ